MLTGALDAVGAVAGGIAAVTVSSSPARVAGEAGATTSYAAVANSMLAGAREVTSVTKKVGLAIVAVHPSPASDARS